MINFFGNMITRLNLLSTGAVKFLISNWVNEVPENYVNEDGDQYILKGRL